jgi:hypothetical protein
MSKRILAWIFVLVFGLLSLGGLLWSMFGTNQLVFTQSEIQERLNRQLPRTVRDVTIERVLVQLEENHLALRADIQGTVLRQLVSAVLLARGFPRYEASSGELHFDADNIEIEQVMIAGRNVPPAARAALQRVAEPALKTYLTMRPVYRFKDDFKGVVLKAALVDVAVERNTLAVTFSLWNLTAAVAVFAFLAFGVLLIIYFLVRHPLWGLEIASDIANIASH